MSSQGPGEKTHLQVQLEQEVREVLRLSQAGDSRALRSYADRLSPEQLALQLTPGYGVDQLDTDHDRAAARDLVRALIEQRCARDTEAAARGIRWASILIGVAGVVVPLAIAVLQARALVAAAQSG